MPLHRVLSCLVAVLLAAGIITGAITSSSVLRPVLPVQQSGTAAGFPHRTSAAADLGACRGRPCRLCGPWRWQAAPGAGGAIHHLGARGAWRGRTRDETETAEVPRPGQDFRGTASLLSTRSTECARVQPEDQQETAAERRGASDVRERGRDEDVVHVHYRRELPFAGWGVDTDQHHPGACRAGTGSPLAPRSRQPLPPRPRGGQKSLRRRRSRSRGTRPRGTWCLFQSGAATSWGSASVAPRR